MDLLNELQCSFDDLQAKLDVFSQSALEDHLLPVYLPHSEDTPLPPEERRKLALQAMTAIFKDDKQGDLPISGVMCASAGTCDAALELNKAKNNFKEHVLRIKSELSSDGRHVRIEELVGRLLGHIYDRDSAIKDAMSKLSLTGIDLNRAYANIRILPGNLRHVSWTWGKKHSLVNKISHAEALTAAGKIADEEIRAMAMEKLAMLPETENLALKMDLPGQLRANVAWTENGKQQRKTFAVSGVMITPDQDLPLCAWRNPYDGEDERSSYRIPRSDATLEGTPYIKKLGLFRYVKPRETKDS